MQGISGPDDLVFRRTGSMKLSNAPAGVLDEHHKLTARTVPTPFCQRMISKWGLVVVPEKDPFALQVILQEVVLTENNPENDDEKCPRNLKKNDGTR